jgi:hypothetical protein
MIAAAYGRSSGYNYDFSYFKNGNLSMLWLRKGKTIKTDNMCVTIPSVSEIGKDSYSPIEFFDNFTIKFCITLSDIQFFNYIIPENSRLHFGRDGKLMSFIIYKDWFYNDIQYKDGQQFLIRENLIVPNIREYKKSLLSTEDQALILNP